MIVLPTYASLGKPISLKFLAEKIVKLMNNKPVFSKKIKNTKKNQQLILETKSSIIGQKLSEQMHEKSENLLPFSRDRNIKKIKLYKNHSLKSVELKIMKSKDLKQIRNICSKAFKTYKNKNIKSKVLLKNII